jgi:hypothetical protein
MVRLSGDQDSVDKAFSEIIEKARALGMIGEELQINKVAKKVESKKLKDRSTSDIMVKAAGNEANIEAFMEDVISRVSQDLSLDSPSTSLKRLLGNDHEEK